jgi:flagellar biosynthesis GTPase FlhF
MKIKSYFSRTIEDAIAMARQVLGPDAMLVNSRTAAPEARHLGEYEVVFGEAAIAPAPEAPARPPAEFPAHSSSGDRIAAEVAALKRQLESMRRTLTKSVLAPSQWSTASPILSETYSLLTANGVAADLAQQIVQDAAARTGTAGNGSHHDPIRNVYVWRDALREEMRSRLSIEPVLGVSTGRTR